MPSYSKWSNRFKDLLQKIHISASRLPENENLISVECLLFWVSLRVHKSF